jgi:hypothetical protein
VREAVDELRQMARTSKRPTADRLHWFATLLQDQSDEIERLQGSLVMAIRHMGGVSPTLADAAERQSEDHCGHAAGSDDDYSVGYHEGAAAALTRFARRLRGEAA